MLQPLVRRTWAPQGQTPIQHQWESHDRLSVIAGVSVAPRRCRLGLYWSIQRRNIRGEDVVGFLRQIRRHLRRRIVLILDRWGVHKSATVTEYLRRHSDTIHVEQLPSYAPDLNPVEQVWNHTKYADLPNLAPNDLEELEPLVNSSITQTRSQSRLIRSFFQMAGLHL
jgi:transposase